MVAAGSRLNGVLKRTHTYTHTYTCIFTWKCKKKNISAALTEIYTEGGENFIHILRDNI